MRVGLAHAALLEARDVAVSIIPPENGLQGAATVDHEIVHRKRAGRAADWLARRCAKAAVRATADAVDLSRKVVQIIPTAFWFGAAKVLRQVRSLQEAVTACGTTAGNVPTQVDDAAGVLQIERVLYQREPFLVEALGFKGCEVLLVHVLVCNHVVAARLEELWENDGAANLAVDRHVAAVGAISPALVAAGLGDLGNIAVVGVRVAHEPAAARWVQRLEAVIVCARQSGW